MPWRYDARSVGAGNTNLRARYSERPERDGVPADAEGRDLDLALAGLRQRAIRIGEKPRVLLWPKTDKKAVVAALVPKGSDVFARRGARARAGTWANNDLIRAHLLR